MDWRLPSPLKIRHWITGIHQGSEVTGASLLALVPMCEIQEPCQHFVIWTLCDEMTVSTVKQRLCDNADILGEKSGDQTIHVMDR